MTDKVEFGEFLVAIEDVNQLENMRNHFVGIVNGEQCQCDALKAEEVGQCNERKTANRMDDFRLLIFLFDLLQIQFRQHVKIVGQLNDKEQLMQENHLMIWKLVIQQGQLAKVSLAYDHIQSPHARHQIEHEQLTRIVEASQFKL